MSPIKPFWQHVAYPAPQSSQSRIIIDVSKFVTTFLHRKTLPQCPTALIPTWSYSKNSSFLSGYISWQMTKYMACSAFLFFQAIKYFVKRVKFKRQLIMFLILYFARKGNCSLAILSKNPLFQVKQEHFSISLQSIAS